MLQEKAKLEEPKFALKADISEAHRQVPADARDWHFLGCQVTPGSDVYVHTVGTYGIASASYFWSASHRTWRGIKLTRGTCESRMTVISTQEAERTAQP